jgi:multicomponent Na+:H+ antiporter subunit F
MTGTAIFHFMAIVGFIIISIAAMLTFVRILKGPSLTRRITASDLMANLVIAGIILFAQWSDNAIYLNVIIGLALVIFLSTVAYAQYIQSRISRKGNTNHD